MALAPDITDLDDATILKNILYNLRIKLAHTRAGVQIAGVLGPRSDQPEDDGVPFTAETCEITYRYLREHGIACLRIHTHGPHDSLYSILVGRDAAMVDAMVEMMRKKVRRAAYTRPGFRMDILDSLVIH